MVADAKSEALFALHRFGFGPRAGSATAIRNDPRGALLAAIERPGAALLTVSMPSSGEAARAALEAREARRATRLAREAARTANPSATPPDASATPNLPATPPSGAPTTPNPPRPNADPADLSRPAEAPTTRAKSSRNGGRDHLGMVGGIISEWRATSFRNHGRHRPESASYSGEAITGAIRYSSVIWELARMMTIRDRSRKSRFGLKWQIYDYLYSVTSRNGDGAYQQAPSHWMRARKAYIRANTNDFTVWDYSTQDQSLHIGNGFVQESPSTAADVTYPTAQTLAVGNSPSYDAGLTGSIRALILYGNTQTNRDAISTYLNSSAAFNNPPIPFTYVKDGFTWDSQTLGMPGWDTTDVFDTNGIGWGNEFAGYDWSFSKAQTANNMGVPPALAGVAVEV